MSSLIMPLFLFLPFVSSLMAQETNDTIFPWSQLPINRSHFGVVVESRQIFRNETISSTENIISSVHAIAAKVSKVLISLDSPGDNQPLETYTKYLLAAVAENSKHRDNSPLQLFIKYKIGSLKFTDRIIRAKHFSNKVNNTYSNTIKHLVVDVEGATLEMINAEVTATKTEIINSRIECKFGMSAGFSFCVDNSALNTYMSRIYETFDFLLLDLSFKLACPDDAILNCFLKRIKTCQEKLKEKEPRMVVMFETGSTTSFIDSASSIIPFWKEINSWAGEKNITVFVNQPGVIKNIQDFSIYSHHTPKFSAKIHNNSTATKYCGETSATKYLNVSAVHFNASFSRTHFGVYFYPSVKKFDDESSYDENDIVSFVELISTRFAIIMTRPINKIENRSITHVFRAVARVNQKIAENQESKTNDKNAQNMLKVLMGYNLESTLPFDVVKRLADQANSIFQGTVEYFMLFALRFEESQLTSLINQFISIKQAISAPMNNGGGDYKLGGVLHYDICLQMNSSKYEYVTPMLNGITLLLFSVVLDDNDILLGSEKFHDKFISKLDKCLTIVGKQVLKIPVGFTVGWPDTNNLGVRNATGLTWFWQKMNDWAVRKNVLFVMDSAFDDPQDKNKNSMGWWRFVEDMPCYSSTREYFFQEKLFEPTLYPDKTKSQTIMGIPYMTVVISVIVSIILVIAIATVIAVVILRRMRRNDLNAALYLSQKEIKEFFDGNKKSCDGLSNNDDENYAKFSALIESCGYDESLEIHTNEFVLDDDSTLGSGAFGIVCLGQIRKDNGMVKVAAKRVKLDGNDGGLCSLRSLLSEIKVLSFIGRHENIINLLGAHTERIKKGDVYAFLELCSLGCLEKYLRKIKKSGTELTDSTYLVLDDENEGESDALHDRLLKWSKEIANGMEYLSSKHVVHADLATRNVLLDSWKRAKICDFGLSRRMYNYQSYVKTQQEPLPWRHMSPESLRLFIFNEKTDVWSFGVTLWEMYTLGNVPYGGLAWTLDFVSQLEDGLRLPRPRHDESRAQMLNTLYTIMLLCWEKDTNVRPTFRVLNAMLNDTSA